MASSPDQPFLTEYTQRSLDQYYQLAFSLSQRQIPSHEIDLEELVQQYGRFKIWTEQTRAAITQRGSLEETLRDEPSVRERITCSLRIISTKLGRALAFLQRKSSDSIEEHSDVESFISDSDGTGDSGDDSSVDIDHDAPDRPAPKVSVLAFFLRHVYEHTNGLYEFSTFLRRPRIKARYIHSTQGGSASFDFPDPEPYEFSHVEQKMKAWIVPRPQSLRESHADDSETEADLPSRDGHGKGKCKDIMDGPEPESVKLPPEMETLCRRLAMANSRRREQLRYWESHPCATRQPQRDLELSGDDSTIGPSQKHAPSLRSSTKMTIRSGSSVATSAIFEEKQPSPAAAPKTIYAESAVGVDEVAEMRVPKVPEESLTNPYFQCPLCSMMLESSVMQDRNTWKRHVFRDLRPYTCTFPECPDPAKLYVTRHDWVYHEMQVHRRQWTCRWCQEVCMSLALLATHLKTAHPETDISDQNLNKVLQLSEDTLDLASQQECIFCKMSMSLKKLMDHAAEHMESLALFSLPKGHDGAPDDESEPELAVEKTILAEPHPDRPASQYELAKADQADERVKEAIYDGAFNDESELSNQGKHAEAETIYRQALHNLSGSSGTHPPRESQDSASKTSASHHKLLSPGLLKHNTSTTMPSASSSRRTHYVRVWIWYCDNCNSDQYWIQKTTEVCLDCYHHRCAYCPIQMAEVPSHN